MPVFFELFDFVTRKPIADLPVMKGATWAAQLNRPDALSCSIDMRSRDARALDLSSAEEGKKTAMRARDGRDRTLAWGLIDGERAWDEDKRVVTLSASGIWGSWLGDAIVAPAAARTEPLTTTDSKGRVTPNAALDTTFNSLSLGSIARGLVAQRLAWPGSPPMTLPASVAGTHQRTYKFAELKNLGDALTDLTAVEGGPDIAFDATRAADGLTLTYSMRVGTDTNPRIGADVGIWALGTASPLSGFTFSESYDDMASAAWASAGRSSGGVLLARALNADPATTGYPPLDFVDTTHSDVSRQSTLDAYARAGAYYARRPYRSVTFHVHGDASPALGDYRPGDFVRIDVPLDHPWPPLRTGLALRVTSISGDETGTLVEIGCEVL